MKKGLFVLAAFFCLAALAACGGPAASGQGGMKMASSASAPAVSAEAEVKTEIRFPACEVENPSGLPYIDELNRMAPFTVALDLPSGWTLRESNGGETVPPGEFYTPVYLYEGEKLIGYIGFNTFEPYEEEIAPEEYYKTVYPPLRLPSIFHWDPYTPVATGEDGETGVVDIWYLDPDKIDEHPGAMPEVPSLETRGILCYDKGLGVYVGIAFLPGSIEEDQLQAIARSVSLSAA